jgi:uncharacterized protein YceH (UPF0502 family)
MYADTYAEKCRFFVVDAAQHRRGPRKAVLAEIARETGLHARRVFAHFYGQVKAPTAAEWEALKGWHARQAQREIAQLQQRLAELAAHDHR